MDPSASSSTLNPSLLNSMDPGFITTNHVVSVLWTVVLQDFFYEVFLEQTSHPPWKEHCFNPFRVFKARL